jgi:hypothetical protein
MRERGQSSNGLPAPAGSRLGWGFFDRRTGEFSTGVDSSGRTVNCCCPLGSSVAMGSQIYLVRPRRDRLNPDYVTRKKTSSCGQNATPCLESQPQSGFDQPVLPLINFGPKLRVWVDEHICLVSIRTSRAFTHLDHFHEKAKSSQEPKSAVADFFLLVFWFHRQGHSHPPGVLSLLS